MANLAGKFSEVKVARVEARYLTSGSVMVTRARRAYNRAVRREGRRECACGTSPHFDFCPGETPE